MTWIALLAASAGCYAFKVLGLSLPERALRDPRIRRMAELLPVALLAALIVTQAFASGHRLVADPRAAGLAAALAAIALRVPFLAVIVIAATVAALVRLA